LYDIYSLATAQKSVGYIRLLPLLEANTVLQGMEEAKQAIKAED